jgi:hypothetical protein
MEGGNQNLYMATDLYKAIEALSRERASIRSS